jgi:hypothetical protein
LSTAGDSSLRTITVTAKASGKTATVPVQVVSGATSSTVQMGSPAGAGFKASVIGISSTSLSAGGSASLTVALQQSDGTLYTQPATVTFSSNCAAEPRQDHVPRSHQHRCCHRNVRSVGLQRQ